MSESIAIIAGAGRFPFHVARAAKRRGLHVVVAGIEGWVDRLLADEADVYEELGVGQLQQLMEYLKAHHIRQAVMAGKVTKDVLLDHRTVFDQEAARVLQQASDRSVPALLGAIGSRLAQAGVALLDSSTFLQDDVCPAGVVTDKAPSPSEQRDIELGVQVARVLAAQDVGQTVVVKSRVVVAVEALEGTDAAIRRAQSLAGPGCVVVKVASAQQDRRFDLPVIGAETIAVLREAGVGCLAVEAGATLLLDRPSLIAAANQAGLSLVGVIPS